MITYLIVFALTLISCRDFAPPQPPEENIDTTSHDFAWERLKLGDGGSSVLLDVAIVSDTLAFAVGAIYTNDSFGNLDPLPYNMAKWNGRDWELQRVLYSDFGNPRPPARPGPLHAVFAFGANEVFVASSANLLYWNGISWEERAFFMTDISWNGRVRKMWGEDGTALICVGENGAVYLVDASGGSWRKLESGTTLDIRDTYGVRDTQTGSLEIIAVASKQYQSLDRKILRFRGLISESLPDSPISQPLTACWFVPGTRYFVGGSGIYEKARLDDSLWQHSSHEITTYYIEAIRGAAGNDLFAVGDFGEVLHFNGRTWKSYLAQTQIASGAYYAVAMKGNLVLAVGEASPRAVILMGSRIN